MPRKLKLTLISKDSSRKATFKKRKKSIMKKVKELSILCGINACAIIYNPYDSNPVLWPSNSGVQRVVSDFRALPEMTQHKNMVDQETFLRQRIAKASEKLKKVRKDNRELEMTEVMFQCLVGNMGMFNLNIVDLYDLGYLVDQYVRDLNHRMYTLENSGTEIGESSNVVGAVAPFGGIGMVAAVTPTTAPAAMIHEVGSSSSASSAAFFNRIQHHHHPYHQQYYRPSAPHVGLYEQPWNLNHNQSQQQCFMEPINNPEEMSYPAEQTGFPFMDENHHHHHHNQPQQHQIPGDTSTDPTAVSSSSLIPVISPNHTNNM